MAIRLFLIPCLTPEDRPAVVQLHLLGQGYGFEVSREQRTASILLSAGTRDRIASADVALLLATAPPNDHARAELHEARRAGVPTIALFERGKVTVRDAAPFDRTGDVADLAQSVETAWSKATVGGMPRGFTADTVRAVQLFALVAVSLLALDTVARALREQTAS